jgi:hypothetical protein
MRQPDGKSAIIGGPTSPSRTHTEGRMNVVTVLGGFVMHRTRNIVGS